MSFVQLILSNPMLLFARKRILNVKEIFVKELFVFKLTFDFYNMISV